VVWQPETGEGGVKPLYRVPSMAEVASTPANGLTMISTFSGCGGTCLGFRMAGYRVLWANDSDAHAQSCYRANHPDTTLDTRDIRTVTAADIIAATGLDPGDLDVFEGSPPCTVFSTAGPRHKKWGGQRRHAGARDVAIEELFFEWTRLLAGLQPRAFVAENVAGLVKGVSKGWFKEILRQMRSLDYRVEARLLDAQWLGVPQQRERIIFVGVREDIGVAPRFPAPYAWRYSVRDALPTIDRVEGHCYGPIDRSPDLPMLTITASLQQRLKARVGKTVREFTIAELKRLCSFPDDFVLDGPVAKQRARLGNAVPPLMASAVACSLRDALTAYLTRRT
jgi:DNA (cytosine-5)-methyltransferase 1